MAELNHVSHSQLSMWRRCPRQWEYRYVYGLKEPPSGALMIGGCYHKALEINFTQKVGTFIDLPVDECLDIYSDEWDVRVHEEESIDWENSTPGESKDIGVGLVGEYMTSTAFTVQPIEVEREIWSEIASVPFVCRIDMRDMNKIVIDHKTSARSYTQDDVDKDHQATVAAFVLGSAIVFHNHVAIKTKVPRIQIAKTYRLDTDVQWWLEMTMLDIAQMKTGIAPPRSEGWHCSEKYCGYWHRCRGLLSKRTFG